METDEMEQGQPAEMSKKEVKLIKTNVVLKVILRWSKDKNFDFGDSEPIALLNMLAKQKQRLLDNEEYELLPDTEACIKHVTDFISLYE